MAADPTMPFWGGPDGQSSSVDDGERVYSIGNSGLRAGQPGEKEGVVLVSSEEGWNQQVYTATPGIPGDSGSGFLDSEGDAFGVLVTVEVLPFAGSNGVSNLTRLMDYAEAHGVPGLELVTGGAFAP